MGLAPGLRSHVQTFSQKHEVLFDAPQERTEAVKLEVRPVILAGSPIESVARMQEVGLGRLPVLSTAASIQRSTAAARAATCPQDQA